MCSTFYSPWVPLTGAAPQLLGPARRGAREEVPAADRGEGQGGGGEGGGPAGEGGADPARVQD